MSETLLDNSGRYSFPQRGDASTGAAYVTVVGLSIGGPQVATAVSEGSVTIGAASAADIVTAGASPVGIEFYNRGPNDATYRIGATATGAATERTLRSGEAKRLPYSTALKLSVYSVSGTVIEWETWS